MGFFNSLSIRITLALMGGVLYSLLTYGIALLIDFTSGFATLSSVLVFFFYFSSRVLILFSGINSPYYSKKEEGAQKRPDETNPFYQTTQWVGKFYHHHDMVLFIFLTVTAVAFLISLIIDWAVNQPFGKIVQNFWNLLFPLP